MSTPTEFYRWWISDERTGKRRRTTYELTRERAAERFPDAEPDLRTREVRDLPESGEEARQHSAASGDAMTRQSRFAS
jgi:hypothetical protein